MSFHGKETSLDGDLAAIERALASLTPASPSVDRDRLMFFAGQRSAQAKRIGSWLWPASTAAMTFLAATLAVVQVRHHQSLPPPIQAEGTDLIAHTAQNHVGANEPNRVATVSEFVVVPSRWQYSRLRWHALDTTLGAGEGAVIAPVSGVRDQRLFQLRSRWLSQEFSHELPL